MNKKSIVMALCLSVAVSAFAQFTPEKRAVGAAEAAASRPAVEVKLVQKKVVSGDKGVEQLADADTARPDDVIEYQATYTNRSDKAVSQVVANLPLPEGLEYVPGSARPAQGVKLSAQDKQFGTEPLSRRSATGKTEPVPYSEYRDVRWTIGQIPPGTTRDVLQDVTGVLVDLTNSPGGVNTGAGADVGTGPSASPTTTFTVSAGAAVVPTTSLATGANASSATGNGTVVPDGSTVTVSGIAYTYSRVANQLSFAAPAGGTATMSFGEVPSSTFSAPGNRQSAVNTPVTYAHNFVAGTAGSLTLSITGEVSSPSNANATWSGLIYADPGCTGTLQSGATQLYPGGATISVVQGQIVCVIVKEQVPANADTASVNQTTVQATLSFANASPSLSASHALVDRTTIGNIALALTKEVRNLTTGGPWGTSNQARSGQVLEYRVTYTNNSLATMSAFAVDDATPRYTTFQSATAGATPTALGNCRKTTPQNAAPAAQVACSAAQAAGGTGAVRWIFDGVLGPSATGDVRMTVVVD